MSKLDQFEHPVFRRGYVFGTEPNAFLARRRDRLKPGQRAPRSPPARGETARSWPSLASTLPCRSIFRPRPSPRRQGSPPRAASPSGAGADRSPLLDLADRASTWWWPSFSVPGGSGCPPADLRRRQAQPAERWTPPPSGIPSGATRLWHGRAAYRGEPLHPGPIRGDFEILELGEHKIGSFSEGVGHAGMSALDRPRRPEASRGSTQRDEVLTQASPRRSMTPSTAAKSRSRSCGRDRR